MTKVPENHQFSIRNRHFVLLFDKNAKIATFWVANRQNMLAPLSLSKSPLWRQIATSGSPVCHSSKNAVLVRTKIGKKRDF